MGQGGQAWTGVGSRQRVSAPGLMHPDHARSALPEEVGHPRTHQESVDVRLTSACVGSGRMLAPARRSLHCAGAGMTTRTPVGGYEAWTGVGGAASIRAPLQPPTHPRTQAAQALQHTRMSVGPRGRDAAAECVPSTHAPAVDSRQQTADSVRSRVRQCSAVNSAWSRRPRKKQCVFCCQAVTFRSRVRGSVR